MIVTITGADLTGKTTQFEIMKQKFDQKGIKYTAFSFPDYTTPIGKLMGAMLDGREISISGVDGDLRGGGDYLGKVKKGGPSTIYQLLAIANMFENQEKIREANKIGHVLCCRYEIDSLVYGMIDCDKKIEWIKLVQESLLKSDLVIVLESSGFTRSEIPDDNESKKWFQDAVRLYYHTLALQEDWYTVNCNRYSNLEQQASINMVSNEIMQILKQNDIDLF